MSKEKDNEKIKENIETKIDLLENILASEKKIDLLTEVDDLNTKYFHTLENLKEARPVFAGCDEAFVSVANKLLRNFELLYSLLEAQYHGEIKRRIAFLEAVNERIEPFYWNTKWLHKPRQNYAATLVDIESDEVMKKVFSKKEQEIFEKYLKATSDEQSEGEAAEMRYRILHVFGGDAGTKSPQNASESIGQSAVGEVSTSTEEPAEGENNALAAVPADENAQKKARPKKSKKEKNECA